MRRLVLLTFIAALGMLQMSSSGGTAGADSTDIKIEAVIWQFNRDYPGAEANDLNLPIRTVYIKTHDGTDWMSTYDPNPNAVSGPDALRNLITTYSFQGIDVAAWFVPYGTDIEGQLQRAKEVIDTGVKGLYADVEPFSGFCNQDCALLAEQFWKRLRAERPNAVLGVTYDPRTQWQEPAALSTWLSVADVAAPDCYWDTFAGQGVWGHPGTCLLQAHADLKALTPGRDVEFAPMLQGDTSGPKMRVALDTALFLGAERVSLWRRGVVPSEVWNEIKAYVGELNRPCWVTRSDNCLIQEPGGPAWLIQGGARFPVAGLEELLALGYEPGDVRAVPRGFLDLLPLIPRDGTLLVRSGGGVVYVVYAGGRFAIPNPEAFDSILLDWTAIRFVPPSGLAQVPERPKDYNRFREVGEPEQYVIIEGEKLHLDAVLLDLLVKAGSGIEMYTLWDGAMGVFPDITLLHGDVSCDGEVDAVDSLRILQTTAGIDNLGICVGRMGDLNCDGRADSVDALLILRWVAGIGLPTPTPSPTPEPTPEASPTPEATLEPSPTPTPTAAPSAAAIAMSTPTPTATPTPDPTPSPTPSPTPFPTPPSGCPPIGTP